MGFTCPDKVAVQGVHVDVLTHRLGSSHQGLAHNLTPKEPLGGGYPVMPSSVGRGKRKRLEERKPLGSVSLK